MLKQFYWSPEVIRIPKRYNMSKKFKLSQRKSYKWISKIVTHPQTYPQTHRPTKPLLILDISNIFPHSTYSIFRLASMHTKHMYLQTSFHLQYYSTLYTFKLRSDFMHSIHMHLQTIFRRQYFSTLCAIKPKHRSMLLIHMYSQIILRRRYISTRGERSDPKFSASAWPRRFTVLYCIVMYCTVLYCTVL